MRKSGIIVLLTAALLACAFALAPATASAQGGEGWSDTAVVALSPSEVPNLTTPIPSGQNPMGVAIIQMNESSDQVCYQLWVSGIYNVTQAHIHQGAPGVEGPPVAWLYPEEKGDQANSANTTKYPGNFTGLLAAGNINASDLVGPMQGKSLDDLVAAMMGGQLYVNVHTTQNPAGEIRGQINETNIWTSSLAVPMTPLEEPTLNYTDSTWNVSGLPMGSPPSMDALKGKNLRVTPWGVGVVQQNGSNAHYALWVFNIANVTQAHFHMAPAGAQGDVVAWLYPSATATAPATVAPDQVGVLMNGKLVEGNVSAQNLVGPMQGGTIESLFSAMGNGTIYFNVHTTQNPGGEIRGQIDPANMTCGMAAGQQQQQSPPPSAPSYAV